MRLALVALLAAAAAFAAEEVKNGLCAPPPDKASPTLPARLMSGMGQVNFPITTSNPEAQKFFNQGVAQMHSFWAREAERSFLQAAALDPEAAMPWWGVAMVAVGDFRPQFQIEAADEIMGKSLNTNPRATAAVEQARKLAARKSTELEKLYIAAIAARRNLKSKTPTADYIAALRQLLVRYPNEVEARLYASLQLMRGYDQPSKEPRESTMEAVGILRQLRDEMPEHPGVHHFIIHAWEGSTFAVDAEASARKYATLAPEIPHALHMPGHIFSQTGKWSEAAHYFALCRVKELEYMAADQLYGNGHHGHNVHYLASSYSFGGDYDKAISHAKELLAYKQTPREAEQLDTLYATFRQAQYAVIRVLVQHEKWDTILDGQTIPVIDKPRTRGWRAFALGLAHAAQGHLAEARAELKALDQAVEDLTKMSYDKEARELNVARLDLRGHLELAEGKREQGFKTLWTASDRERRLRYSEPPWYPRPVAEALGWAALRLKDPAQAARAFAVALEQYPASARSLVGRAQAGSAGAPATAP